MESLNTSIIKPFRLGRCCRNNERTVRPRCVGQTTLIFWALIGAAPWGVGSEVEIALANGVTTWIRPRFEVLALCAHRHDYTLDGCKEPLVELSDGAFHLELDETTPLDCVLHWERASDWLDEAVDNH